MTGFLNRVKVLTATTGQGTSIVLGAAVNDSFFAPADVGAVNAETYSYIIIQGLDFEIQLGQVYTASGTSIARGTPYKSKIGGTVGTTKIDLDGTALVGFIASANELAVMIAAASDTVAGRVELATSAEAEAQTDTTRACTPSSLANFALLSEVTKTQVGLANVTNDAQLKIASNLSDVNNSATAFGNIKQPASDTATGVVELATVAEADAQTDTTRACTPASLANFALLSEVTKTQVGLGNVTNDAQLKIASNLSDVNNAATAFGNIKQAASTTATGVAELATQTEAEARTDTARTVTPGSMANFVLSTEVTAAVSAASDTVAGKVELATVAEAEAQTDTARAVTPAGLANFALLSEVTKAQVGLSNVTNDAQLKIASNLSDLNNAATAFGNIKQAASETATGVVELATVAEAEAQTDTSRAVTPAGLANFALTSEVTGAVAAASDTAAGKVELATVAEAEAQTDTARAVTPAGLANFALLSEVTKAQVGLSNVTNDAQLKIASNLSDVNNAATAYGNIKQAATESSSGAIEHATDAEVRAGTSGNYALTAAKITSANVSVGLTDAATIAVDWAAGINYTVSLTASRILGLPSNGIPGTWRSLLITQPAGGACALTYATGWKYANNVAPAISTAANAVSRLSLYCRSASIFEAYLAGPALAGP